MYTYVCTWRTEEVSRGREWVCVCGGDSAERYIGWTPLVVSRAARARHSATINNGLPHCRTVNHPVPRVDGRGGVVWEGGTGAGPAWNESHSSMSDVYPFALFAHRMFLLTHIHAHSSDLATNPTVHTHIYVEYTPSSTSPPPSIPLLDMKWMEPPHVKLDLKWWF